MAADETTKNWPRDRSALTLPTAALCPVLRCFYRDPSSPASVCGQIALWTRAGGVWFSDEHFCTKHRASSDVPIGELAIVRRVHLKLDVYLAGVAINAPQVQAEALARVETALQGIGALVEVDRVASSFVKYPARPASGKANVGPGDPE